MYSYGPPHMAEQKQDDQQEYTYSGYVKIWDVVQKICQRRWSIRKSGKRGSGISVLAARHDDDNDSRWKFVKFHKMCRRIIMAWFCEWRLRKSCSCWQQVCSWLTKLRWDRRAWPQQLQIWSVSDWVELQFFLLIKGQYNRNQEIIFFFYTGYIVRNRK